MIKPGVANRFAKMLEGHGAYLTQINYTYDYSKTVVIHASGEIIYPYPECPTKIDPQEAIKFSGICNDRTGEIYIPRSKGTLQINGRAHCYFRDRVMNLFGGMSLYDVATVKANGPWQEGWFVSLVADIEGKESRPSTVTLNDFYLVFQRWHGRTYYDGDGSPRDYGCGYYDGSPGEIDNLARHGMSNNFIQHDFGCTGYLRYGPW